MMEVSGEGEREGEGEGETQLIPKGVVPFTRTAHPLFFAVGACPSSLELFFVFLLYSSLFFCHYILLSSFVSALSFVDVVYSHSLALS